MEKYLFTTDWHIGHFNILRMCGRPFPTKEKHDIGILERFNERSDLDTTVYNLGDLGFKCSPEYLSDIIHQMKFKKMYILWGNHDEAFYKGYSKGLYKDLKDKIEPIGNYSKDERTLKNIRIGNQQIVLFHYGLRSWDGAFRGSWHLYGHSHGNLPSLYKSMDVGVDTNNYYPYTFEEIQKIMSDRENVFNEQ